MLTATDTYFSFLVGGPRFRFSIPSDFGTLPELSSPLSNGIGGRSFDFQPTGRSNGIPEAYPVIGTLSDSEGRLVELYRWLEEPPQWFLQWHLVNGSIWTHLRVEDGVALAQTTVDALGILEDPAGGTPFLLPNPPLRSAVSGRPGYQEFATYFSSVRPDWRIALQRPGFLSPNQTRVLPAADVRGLIALRVGLPNGMEAQVVGNDRPGMEDVLATISSSLSDG